MKIAILGAGNIGRTLAQKWVAAGHAVMFGVRDAQSDKVQAAVAATGGQAPAGTVAEAAAFGEVVLLSVPYAAVAPLVAEHGAALAGKLIIDATNNFAGPVLINLAAIREYVPGARVYRAFNALGWEVFAQPAFGDTVADLFYCGPAGADGVLLETLIREVGTRPVRVGDLDQIHLVDNLGALWVNLVFRQGMGRRLAFKALS